MAAKGTWIEQVKKRTRGGKTRIDSADPRHFCFDTTIGSVHYKDNPKDLDEPFKEIDNIFEPAPAPWDWQMLRAGYHIRVKEDFTAGQIIEFEKQGESVQFQPMALEWTNDLDQIQQISMPQSITPVITNPEVDLLPAVGMPSHQGTIRWDDGYGDGLDFQWRCSSTRLLKTLEVESFSKLPTPEQYILDGGNPVLRLNLIFDPSSGTDIYVDGELWDRNSKKQTFKVIEFRKDGEVLWGFMPLRYWGSGEGEDNEGQSVATLEKRGNKFYISIRVPYSWLENAVYPVFIDTDVNETIGDDADDASEWVDNTNFDATATSLKVSRVIGSLEAISGLRFPAVAISGDIDVAYITIEAYDSTKDDPNCNIYCEDIDTSLNFTDNADVADRAKTADPASWVATGIGTSYVNSPSIVTTLQHLVDRPGWSSGNDLCILVEGKDYSTSFYFKAYENVDNRPAKLHIEYSAVAPPAGAPWSLASRVAMMGA